MSTSTPETPQRSPQQSNDWSQAWLQRPYLVGTIFACLFGAVTVFALWEAGARKDQPQPIDEDPPSPVEPSKNKTAPGLSTDSAPPFRYPTYEEMERAALINSLDDVAARISGGRTLCSQLMEHAQKWTGAPESLFTAEESKRLASNGEILQELADVLDHMRLSVENVDTWEKQLDVFSRAIDGLKTEGRSPCDEFENELKDLLVGISSAHSKMHEDSYSIHRLKRRAASFVAGGMSLDDALTAARMKAADAAIAQEVINNRDHMAATERRQNEEVKSDARREMKEVLDKAQAAFAEVERAKRQLEDETAAIALTREQFLAELALENRFAREFPKMEKYLVPLTSEGYTQIVRSQFLRTGVRAPVSYRSMVNAGMLNEGDESLSEFFSIIAARGNDRDLGAFPPWIPGEHTYQNHYESILTVQRFVRDFGPFMSAPENGLLAP
jgi:hypothetical protein